MKSIKVFNSVKLHYSFIHIDGFIGVWFCLSAFCFDFGNFWTQEPNIENKGYYCRDKQEVDCFMGSLTICDTACMINILKWEFIDPLFKNRQRAIYLIITYGYGQSFTIIGKSDPVFNILMILLLILLIFPKFKDNIARICWILPYTFLIRTLLVGLILQYFHVVLGNAICRCETHSH